LPSKLAIFGLILLLAGAICLAAGEYKLADINVVPVEQQDSVWSLTVNLTQGTTYGIDIQSSDDWGKPFGRGDFTQPMPVNVTIVSPGGDVTRLQAFFYGLASTSPYYQAGSPPAIVDIKYQNVDSVSLAVDYSTPHIRFTPKQDGPYNVTVLQDGFWSKEPPDYIVFLKEVTPERQTYSLLATFGGVVCTAGGVIFIVSLFKGQNAKRKSRK
jgi:hypothetical protein